MTTCAPFIGAAILAIVSAWHVVGLAVNAGPAAWFLILMGCGSFAFWGAASRALWLKACRERKARHEAYRKILWPAHLRAAK